MMKAVVLFGIVATLSFGSSALAAGSNVADCAKNGSIVDCAHKKMVSECATMDSCPMTSTTTEVAQ